MWLFFTLNWQSLRGIIKEKADSGIEMKPRVVKVDTQLKAAMYIMSKKSRRWFLCDISVK